MELHLTQKELARRFRVSVDTIYQWEADQEEPKTPRLPGIIEFLGGWPLPEPQSGAEKLRQFRLRRGLNLGRLARLLGVTGREAMDWERGLSEIPDRVLRQLENIDAGDAPDSP